MRQRYLSGVVMLLMIGCLSAFAGAQGNPWWNNADQPWAGCNPWPNMPDYGPQKIKAAYLGVTTSAVPAALRAQLRLERNIGLMVDFVEPHSPADQAGLRRFDVLQKLDDQLLINSPQLMVLVRTFRPGDEIKLMALRHGQPLTLTARLIEREVYVIDGDGNWSMTWDIPVPSLPAAPSMPSMPEVPQIPDYNPSWNWPMPNRNGPNPPPPAPQPPMPGAQPPMPGAQPVYPPSSQPAAAVPVPSQMRMVWVDPEMELIITGTTATRHLVARDKTGKVLFDGPIATTEQRESLPTDVREKLEQFENRMKNGPTSRPRGGTMPSGRFRLDIDPYGMGAGAPTFQ